MRWNGEVMKLAWKAFLGRQWKRLEDKGNILEVLFSHWPSTSSWTDSFLRSRRKVLKRRVRVESDADLFMRKVKVSKSCWASSRVIRVCTAYLDRGLANKGTFAANLMLNALHMTECVIKSAKVESRHSGSAQWHLAVRYAHTHHRQSSHEKKATKLASLRKSMKYSRKRCKANPQCDVNRAENHNSS